MIHLSLALAWLANLLQGLLTNAGKDLVSDAVGGMAATDAGTATGVGATTLTDAGKAWTVNAWAGKLVVMANRYGVVLSNTGTVLTIDRWYDSAAPGGAAGSTPAAGAYVVVPGNAPGAWMGLTENATAPAATDTTLAGELAGSGLGRALCTYAHTAGAASYTLTKAFTSADPSTRTVAKAGIFNAQNGGRMVFETLVSPVATLASGDVLTVTSTVSVS